MQLRQVSRVFSRRMGMNVKQAEPQKYMKFKRQLCRLENGKHNTDGEH